jgi:hypothetical protein
MTVTSATCQCSPLVSFFPAITPLCESLAGQLYASLAGKLFASPTVLPQTLAQVQAGLFAIHMPDWWE